MYVGLKESVGQFRFYHQAFVIKALHYHCFNFWGGGGGGGGGGRESISGYLRPL